MPPTRKDVTEAELSVLKLLWEEGPAPIRALTDALYPGGGASEYATVQKLLERLEGKGYVTRKRSVVPHVFRAKVGREHVIARRLRDLADTLCEGSTMPLLTQLLGGEERLSDGDVDALRELVQRLEPADGDEEADR